ncbi:PREDICTED: F-box protein At2g16365-like [Tarenaya hassleriana]|uniref:F-box protein At2g16365-like n=1 Tax=Tarenaya hassleriana TaxID=28532 RepID=UPI00053C2B8B|nr:PREDICTED: F-box protein At2g16365-like [Tarenaya hassleriana]
MSENVMGLDNDSNGMSKKPFHAYESAWLGRWTQTGIEVAQPSQSRLSLKEDAKCSKETSMVSPDIAVGDSAFGKTIRGAVHNEEILKENHGRKPDNEGWGVSPFPIFNVSRQSESITAARNVQNTLCNRFQAYSRMDATLSFHEGEGASSKSMAMSRSLMPSWMHSQEENALPSPSLKQKGQFSSKQYPNISVHVKSTQNTLDLIRPMGICPIVDSGEGTSGEPHTFSQTTRNFFLTKKTDLNLPKDGRVSMKLEGKMFSGFLGLLPNLDLGHQERLKLQSLESLKDWEEGSTKIDEIESSAVCARNASSAETDTLDMDNFQRIRPSGSTSSLSPKGQGRKNQSAVQHVEIPDMNQEPPVVPVDRRGGEASTSETETQSMKMEHFLYNSLLPKESKRVQSDPEHCSTWVKRLKTGASNFSGCGTKSMKIEEASPGENMNDFFQRIVKSNLNNPQTRNKEQHSALQFKNTKLVGKDITLLHPWIQRLCKNKAETSHQTAGQEVDGEPETSKETVLEEIQKKQFPSIAVISDTYLESFELSEY